jgi:hypothetical protein
VRPAGASVYSWRYLARHVIPLVSIADPRATEDVTERAAFGGSDHG